MKNQTRFIWQSLILALSLAFASTDASLAQIDAPLSLGPPPCSMDNPQFNENVDANKCSTLDLLNGVATLPAPNKPAMQIPEITGENSIDNGVAVKQISKTKAPKPVSPIPTANPMALPAVPSQQPAPESLPPVPISELPTSLGGSATAPTPTTLTETPQALAKSTESPSTTTAIPAVDSSDNLLIFLFILLGFASLSLMGLFLLPQANSDDHSEE